MANDLQTDDYEDPPAGTNIDLDSTVDSVISSIPKQIKRATDAQDASDAARKAAATSIEGRNKSINEMVDKQQSLKYEAEKPKFNVPNFQAPDPQYDPVKAFGSSASVLALMASAFTRNPLKNALNSSAAVMEAEQAKDKTAYDRAFNEWKANTDVALKHINFETDMYKQGFDEMKFDYNKGQNTIQSMLALNGNDKMLALFKADPEAAFNAVHSYMGATNNFQKAVTAWSDHKGEVDAVNEARAQAEAEGRPFTAMDEVDIKDQVRQKLAVQRGGSAGSPTQQRLLAIQDQYDSDMAEAAKLEGPERLQAEQVAAQKRDQSRSAIRGNAPKGADALLNDWVASEKAAGRNPTPEQMIAKRQDIMKGGVTGNKKVEIQTQVDQADNALDLLDKNLGTLGKYTGVPGAAGYATRLGERLGNIFGSNSTDRDEFMRDVEQLRLMAPRLLLNTTGRPLSTEAGRINNIIAGLNVGDTTANTVRAFNDLKKIIMQNKRDNELKLKGQWESRANRPETAPASSAPTGTMPWDSDPVVNGR